MQTMKFSKNNFLKRAPLGVKRQMKGHVDTLDGMEVKFDEADGYGYIDRYTINGQEYYLYPICESWCEKE